MRVTIDHIIFSKEVPGIGFSKVRSFLVFCNVKEDYFQYCDMKLYFSDFSEYLSKNFDKYGEFALVVVKNMNITITDQNLFEFCVKNSYKIPAYFEDYVSKEFTVGQHFKFLEYKKHVEENVV